MIVFFSFKSREAKEDVGESREQPKKSISMGQIQPTGNQPSSAQVVPTSGQLAGTLAGSWTPEELQRLNLNSLLFRIVVIN